VSLEANKRAVRDYWLTYENGEVDLLVSHLDPAHVYHGEGSSAVLDYEGRRDEAGFFFAAFSDIRVIIEDQVAESDRVATRLTMYATNSGSFLGQPASGRRVSIPLLDLARVRDGRILEEWAEFDWQSLLRQLGRRD
jgi:predicted ester cyclase